MFKELRKKNGYNTDFVAKELSIKKATLYKIEEYHSLPSIKILLKMQEVYKCSYEEVVNAYAIAKGVHNERRIKKSNQASNNSRCRKSI